MVTPSDARDDHHEPDSAETVIAGPGGAPNRIGDYELTEELGRGGQGIVYRAVDTRLRRPVAVKILSAWAAASDRMMRRFLHEGMIASRLDDPGICTVYETGVEHGVPFIAMRYVDGQSLAARLKADGAPGDRALILSRAAILERVARSLHRAHEAGVVHRDVKPGNIMITRGGDPVILDFGLAGDESGQMTTLTRTGEMQGTVPYMSPEQIDAEAPVRDRRVDVYALGVTLFECLVGRRPFAAATRDGLLDAIRRQDPPRVRALNSTVPRDLETVIETALEKKPERRYDTALALAEDLRRVIDGRPIEARPVSAPGRAWRWASRRPAAAALLVAAALVIPTLAVMAGFIAANLDTIEAQEQRERLDEVERLLAEAYGEIGEGSLDVALRQLDLAIDLMPDNEAAWAGKGLALLRADRAPEARELLERYRRRAEPTEGLRLLARVADADPETAGDLAVKAEVEGPEDLFLAAHVAMLGSHESGNPAMRVAMARAHRAVLLAPAPRPRYHFTLAHAVGHVGDLAMARAVATSLMRLWPDWAEASYWAGFALLPVDEEAALAAFDRTRAIAPEFSRAWSNAGWIKVRQEKFEEAEPLLRRAIELDPSDLVSRCNLALALDAMGRPEESLVESARVLELDPDSEVALDGRARTLMHMGRVEEAATAFREYLRHYPGEAEAHANLGVAYGRLGRLDEAIASLRRAIAIEPNATRYGNLGRGLKLSGKEEEARKAFERGLELDPTDHTCLFQLAFLHNRAGRHEEAVALARRLVESHPDTANDHAALGIMLVDAGRALEAVDAYRRSIELAPNVAWVHHNLGSTLDDLGRFEEASEELERGIELDPRDADLRVTYASCLIHLGEPEDALDVVDRAAELGPESAGLSYARGQALRTLRRLDEAAAAYRRTIELDPSFAEAHCNLGHVLRDLGRLPEAIESLRRGHELGSLRGKAWRYPSETWVREAETMLAGKR